MKYEIAMSGETKYVGIDRADNGYIVKWCEKKKSTNHFDDCPMIDHSKVFTEKELDKAFEFFKEKKVECWKSEKEGYDD